MAQVSAPGMTSTEVVASDGQAAAKILANLWQASRGARGRILHFAEVQVSVPS